MIGQERNNLANIDELLKKIHVSWARVGLLLDYKTKPEVISEVYKIKESAEKILALIGDHTYGY